MSVSNFSKSGTKAVPGISDIAPDFEMTDVQGKPVRLSDYKDSSVLLVFLRYAGCPWCNLTIHRLIMEYPMLRRQNCQVIAFVQSDDTSIKQQVLGRQASVPPFPVIADPNREVYNRYGVGESYAAAAKSMLRLPSWLQAVTKHGFSQGKVDGDFFLVPASFLIARQTREIVRADHGASFYEFEAFFNVYESLIFSEA